MNVLLLGGTTFAGPHLCDALTARGHAVTTFTRGRTPAPERAGVTRRIGDRTDAADLAALARDRWDAVIDTSGYEPDVVRLSAAAFSGARYAFVSSVSVYADFSQPVTEDTPVLDDGDTANEYGAKKAACERVVQALCTDALIVRPGLIVGPLDPTNRFTYYVTRFDEGGDVLVPGPPERPVQFIDVRDLAEFITGALEAGRTGTYDLVAPGGTFTIGDVVATARDGAAHHSTPIWAGAAQLTALGFEGWMDLPLWIGAPGYEHFMNVSGARARAAGLRIRPLRQTVRATREWARSVAAEGRGPAGITREREREAIDRCRAAS